MKFTEETLALYLGGVIELKGDAFGHQVGEIKTIRLENNQLKVGFGWLGSLELGCQEWFRANPLPIEINIEGEPTALDQSDLPGWMFKDIFGSSIRLYHSSRAAYWAERAKHWPVMPGPPVDHEAN